MGWTGMGRTEVVPMSPTINFVGLRSEACLQRLPAYFRIGSNPIIDHSKLWITLSGFESMGDRLSIRKHGLQDDGIKSFLLERPRSLSDFRILWSQLAECVFGDHGPLFNSFGTA
jgi:hypothetical protein